MSVLATATVAAALIVLASMLSVEVGISVALIEIMLGVVGGNLFGLTTTPWMDFLASVASIVLTFLAGAEVDPTLLREKFKASMLIGGLSFLLPFALTIPVAFFLLGRDWRASEIAGVALSTTSLAVVYAVLVETGLTETTLRRLIMAACFSTDFGSALALGPAFGCFADGKLVAMAATHFATGDVVEIGHIATHPDYRRRGYATACTAALTQAAFGLAPRVFLMVMADNTPALAVYKQLGVPHGRAILYDALPSDA